MPTVPLYRPQVRPAPLPHVRRTTPSATAESLGVEVKEAEGRTALVRQQVLGNLTDIVYGHWERGEREQQAEKKREEEELRRKLEREAEELRDRADNLAATNFETALSTFEQVKQREAEAVQGGNAADLPERMMGEHRDKAAELMNGLTNPKQRYMGEIILAKRSVYFQGWLHNYTGKQLQQYEQNSMVASQADAIQSAVSKYDQPAQISGEIRRAENATFKLAAIRGVGDDTFKLMMGEMYTKIHAGVISNLLADKKVVQARDYFNKTQHQIEDSVARTIKTSLASQESLKVSQEAADMIVGKFKNLNDQLEYARKNYEGEEEKDLVAELNNRSLLHERGVELERKENARTLGLLLGTHTPAKPVTLQRLKSQRNEQGEIIWDGLTGAEQRHWQEQLQLVQQGLPKVTNPRRYIELRDMAYSLDPRVQKNFMETKLYQEPLADEDRRRLEARQEQMLGGQLTALSQVAAKTQGDSKFIMDETEAQWQALVGTKPGQLPAEIRALREGSTQRVEAEEQYYVREAQIKMLVRDEVDLAAARNPKGFLTDDEARAVITRVMRTEVKKLTAGSVYGYYYSATSMGIGKVPDTLKATDLTRVTVDDIPVKQRELIEAALRARGITPTKGQILNLFFVATRLRPYVTSAVGVF